MQEPLKQLVSVVAKQELDIAAAYAAIDEWAK
jgi:hypothetical protein